MKEKKEKLTTVVVRISKDKKEEITKVAATQGKCEADVIRNGIEKELNIQRYKDNLDVIIKELDRIIDAKLDPFIKSQRKINAKYLRTSTINTYLQGEVLSRLFGDDMHKDFVKMLSKARDKANYYITHDVERIDKKDLYDFYEIGEIYRDEHRKE